MISDFIFNLGMRKPKPLLSTFWGGLGTQLKKKCFCDKGQTSPWQMPVGRQAGAVDISWSASADDAGVVVYKGTKLHVLAAELWKELVLGVHGASHMSPRQTWQEVLVSVRLAQLCIVVSMIGDMAVQCAWVFPSVGQDLRNNQTNAGIPKDFD